MSRHLLILTILLLSTPSLSGNTYDDGYWTPTSTYYTTWYTPTSTYYYETDYGGGVTTITSYLPCPPTSTVVYYTYDCPTQPCCTQPCCASSCCVAGYWWDTNLNCCWTNDGSGCYQGDGGYAGTVYTGTTTETLYTTTTPSPVQTITSNGYVVVVMDTTTPYGAATQSQVIEVQNRAGPASSDLTGSLGWLSLALAALIACTMLLL